MNNKEFLFPSSEVLVERLAAQIIEDLEKAIQARGKASFVVSGGSTPKKLFQFLSQQNLAWEKVFITLADERWVPETDPDSNTAFLKKELLVGQAARATLVPLYEQSYVYPGVPDDEVKAVTQGLAALPLPIDVLILGMGTDGHTASLFPDSPELKDALEGADVLYRVNSPSVPQSRITFSFKTLRESAHVYLHIEGEAKKKVYEEAKTKSVTQAPIGAFFKEGLTLYWAP